MLISTIETNTPLSQISDKFKKDFITFLSQLLNLPPHDIVLKVRGGMDTMAGKSGQPFIFVKVAASNCCDKKKAASFQKPVLEFFQREWGEQRMLIWFQELQDHWVLDNSA